MSTHLTGSTNSISQTTIHSVQKANLEEHPPSPRTLIAGSQLTIGDLHGNAVKLLWFLIQEGIVKLNSERDYQRIVEIYKKSNPDQPLPEYLKEAKKILSPEDYKQIYKNLKIEIGETELNDFDEILSRATYNKGIDKIRLMGDEMADRGNNDLLTLLILEKLVEQKIPIEIIDSNHGAEFLEFYAEDCSEDFSPSFNETRSLRGLTSLIKRNLVNSDFIKNLIETVYIPNLKLLSYAITERSSPEGPKLTLFTHAPTGLETIKALANKYNIAYKDGNVEELASTIDEINAAYTEAIENNELSEQVEGEPQIGNVYGIALDSPLRRIRWNRHSEDQLDGFLERPEKSPNGKFRLGYVHGHDGAGVVPHASQNPHVLNLDNDFGKGSLEPDVYSIQALHPAAPLLILKKQQGSPSLSEEPKKPDVHP